MTAGHHLLDAFGFGLEVCGLATSPLMRQTPPFSSASVLDRDVNVLSVAIGADVRAPARTATNPMFEEDIADVRVVQHVV